jgi:gamma-glutamyltranspeptidase/glutathione hydrolase
LPLGSGQIIWRDRATGSLIAGSDCRKDGNAAGF